MMSPSAFTIVNVFSRNGAFESGIFVALLTLMNNMEADNEIDVYQVVKLIRKSRPEFITSQVNPIQSHVADCISLKTLFCNIFLLLIKFMFKCDEHLSFILSGYIVA